MDRMVEVKTSELIGAALDWAVGKAQGWGVYPTDSIERGDTWHLDSERAPFGAVMRVADWQPSTRWAQCGSLLTKHITHLSQTRATAWWAHCDDHIGEGHTALTAICRAIVAAKLGDTVSVPAALLENA